MSFEKEFFKFVEKQGITIYDSSNGYIDFDFGLVIDTDTVWIDVKEKKQCYNTKTWKTDIPEKEFFILDERALMKAWGLGFNCGIVVKDCPNNQYHYFSPEVLCFMPRIRGFRQVTTGPMGKLLIDFRWAESSNYLKEIIELISLFNSKGRKPKNIYSEYKGQEYREFGRFRNATWKEKDLIQK